jgi:hypothetical protein
MKIEMIKNDKVKLINNRQTIYVQTYNIILYLLHQ